MSWQDTLLDASYKGVAFEATADTLRGVHALAEHSYPFVDGSDIEDTGCEALEFNLTAVLYGDDYEARLQRPLHGLRRKLAARIALFRQIKKRHKELLLYEKCTSIHL